MKMNKIYAIRCLMFIMMVFYLTSCKKGWLDAKPQQSLANPQNVADYQAMLDNANSKMNTGQPGLDEIGATDYYVNDATYGTLGLIERNALIYARDIYQGTSNISDWEFPYNRIFIANIVLEGISKVVPKNESEKKDLNNVKGAAYFFRAYNHYTIAQVFCKPFIQSSAAVDLGIPLRVTANFNEMSIRSTVLATYEQIISDLKMALELLPVELPNTTVYKVRPTVTAARAMLARVYLSMGDYENAFLYSNQCLQRYNSLMNYNDNPPVNPAAALTPIQRFNPEVIFTMNLITYNSFLFTRLIVDSVLIRSFNSEDLRKLVFFRPSGANYTFRGNYNQSPAGLFSGLATDEMYLIRSECNARLDRITDALSDLNFLIEKRWNKDSVYMPISAVDKNDALNKILLERRKELCFRGLRWTDLRRLNQEPQFATTLTRVFNNQSYTLPPNDPNYVYAIPDNVIGLTGMLQNQRN